VSQGTKVSSVNPCTDPKAGGGVWQEGCLVKTCNSGTVEGSLADECVELIDMNVEKILGERLAEKGNSGCSDESLKQEKAPETPSSEQVSGILITGGEGPEAVTTELFIVENKKVCSLPSLPSPRFGHTLDVVEGMPIVCGGNQDELNDEIHYHSCINFTPLSECGSWQNLTTLQFEFGFDFHPSWVSPHGLVLFGTFFYNNNNVMELLPVTGPAKTQFLEYDYGKRLMEIGGGSCGFDDGGSFILTGNTIYGQGKTVTRFSLEMFDKPGHCSWADDEYCCMNEDYERCRLSKGNVEKLPDMQQTRGKHGCGMYHDKNNAKVYLVAGGWDARVNELSSAEILVEGDTKWTFVTPLPRTLRHAASVSLDNKIFLIGGWHDIAFKQVASDEIITYDEERNNWKVVGKLQTPRADLAATKIDASNLMGFC